jgi:SAM-dependent methyltransferase
VNWITAGALGEGTLLPLWKNGCEMSELESYVGAQWDTAKIGWYRDAIGGLWDEIGQLQFQFLVAQGLVPANYMLDIGCGSLRGGVHAIRYLEPGHYYGFDSHRELIDAGLTHELSSNEAATRRPKLWQTSTFEISAEAPPFEFAIAVSVFTHLPLNIICLCLARVRPALALNGQLFATFFENNLGLAHTEPIRHPSPEGGFETYFARDPYHYTFSTLKWVGEQLDYRVDYIGDWNHLRDQKMLSFRRVRQ